MRNSALAALTMASMSGWLAIFPRTHSIVMPLTVRFVMGMYNLPCAEFNSSAELISGGSNLTGHRMRGRRGLEIRVEPLVGTFLFWLLIVYSTLGS